jgi:tetratricopeptide (TPR) repeat protein
MSGLRFYVAPWIGFAFVVSGAYAQEAGESPDSGEAYYYFCLGRMAEMQMQAETAVSHYQQVARLDPRSPYPHLALADLYLRMRQVDKALESARRAVELGPEVAAAQRTLGAVYHTLLRSQGNPDLAPLAIQAYRETVRLDPGDMQSRSTLGRLLLASRQPTEAAVQLEEVIRREPTSYYDMTLLAQIRQSEGDNARAIELLQQSLAVEPGQPEARERLAALFQSEGRFEDLAGLYEGSIKADPTDVDSRVRYADALANAGRLDEAESEFQKALESDPENVIGRVGLAMVKRELKKFDEAEALLAKVLASDPNHLLARASLAGVYEDRRELDKAIVEWKKLLELPGPDKEAEKGDARRAEYWAHLGFAYGELEKHDEAVEAFSKARELTSGDERYDVFYLQALLAANRSREASDVLAEALQKHPESSRLRVLETRVLDEVGRSDEALEKALALSREEPTDEMRIQAVVDLYQRRKSFSEAEEFLRERLAKMPDHVGMLFLMGAVLERQGKFDDAKEYFEKVLAVEPESAAALNYLGYMLADQGVALDQSLDYVQRALDQDPHNGAYLDSLGWVYFKMGRLDLAEDNLLKALKSLRLTGVVYDHLGDLYFRKGDREQAVRYWRKALDQEDEDLEKDEVARKIEEATSPR